jgi:hypothetical protein
MGMKCQVTRSARGFVAGYLNSVSNYARLKGSGAGELSMALARVSAFTAKLPAMGWARICGVSY